MSAWLNRLFVVNGSLKLIAFVLTLALFIWVREDRQSAVQAFVPVRVQFPEGMVLVSDPPERLRVTVIGRWSDLNTFDPSQVPAVSVEADEDTNGLVSISSDMIELPPGLRIDTIQPNFVRVELEPGATRSVPLRPRIVGEPGQSFALGEVSVRPQRVPVTGPRSSITDLEYLWTEPVDITDRTESFDKRVQLRVDDPLIQYDVDRPITVRVPITTEEVTRTIQEVSVVGVNTTYAIKIRPNSATVTVRGAKPIVDKMSPDSIYAAIDLSEESRKPPGTFSKTARIANLPPDVNLVQFHPNDFLVTTTRAEREPADPDEQRQPPEKESPPRRDNPPGGESP